jgi:preprotein translocase subunit SecD
MLKYWRVIMLLVMVLASVLAIGMKAYPYGRTGVEIAYVSNTSPASGVLLQGMQITAFDGKPVGSPDEWKSLTQDLPASFSITADGKNYGFTSNGTQSVGIDVMGLERTNLDFGLDLRGGTRIILQPSGENLTKEDITQVIATLNTRANLYGLKELKISPLTAADGTSFIQIEAAGLSRQVIDELLSTQGTFRAAVSKPVALAGGQGQLELGSKSYGVSVTGNGTTLLVNGMTAAQNGTFELDGITFQYVNATASTLNLMADVYTGKDIELVYSDPQRSGVRPVSGGYQFFFVVLVSEEGAERFADVTTGIPSVLDVSTGERYLDSRIYLYLDDKLVSDLRISSDLGGKVYNTPQITGSRADINDATDEKLRLQTILRSGALPAKLNTVSVDVISPTLGSTFLSSALLAAGLAGAAIIAIVFLRYRKLSVSLPLAFTGFSEAVIILGIAATGDSAIWLSVLVFNFLLVSVAWWKKHEIDIFAWMGAIIVPLLGLMSWTIDLPAIAGVIAVLGTGMDQQIIIADETLRGVEKRTYTMKDKIKRAFFIIFGSAATQIAAMTPLLFIGIGLLRGFAITTLVGVLVGILITRPAYARIVELGIRRGQPAHP